MEKVDLLVCLDKMDVPDPVALLDPEDSLELWDSPDPKEPAASLVRAVRKDQMVLPDLSVPLAKMVMLVLLDLPALLDLPERRESKDPLDLLDSRVFLDPKVLLVRLASLASRAVPVSPDPLAHPDQEEREVSPVSAVATDPSAQWEAVVLLALLVAMEPRERLVLVVPPVVKEAPVCRECPVSVEQVVSPASREREVMLEPREVMAHSAKMACVA